jgi:peptidyl-dipeptidase A
MGKLGLLAETEADEERTINNLYKEALDKLPFLPNALVMDQFRWDIFQGKVKPEGYNCHWWDLRRKVQGLKPPNVRRPEDFDAGSKWHIPYGEKRSVVSRAMT